MLVPLPRPITRDKRGTAQPGFAFKHLCTRNSPVRDFYYRSMASDSVVDTPRAGRTQAESIL